MSVSASAVNGSFGCLVFVVVWFSRFFTWFPWSLRFLWISQGSRFFCGFRGYLGYPLFGHVLFCESCGLFLELLWFSWYLWSSWFFSSSHGLSGSPVLVVPVLLLAILDAMVSSLFLVVRVVLLLHSSSSLFPLLWWSSRFLHLSWSQCDSSG